MYINKVNIYIGEIVRCRCVNCKFSTCCFVYGVKLADLVNPAMTRKSIKLCHARYILYILLDRYRIELDHR